MSNNAQMILCIDENGELSNFDVISCAINWIKTCYRDDPFSILVTNKTAAEYIGIKPDHVKSLARDNKVGKINIGSRTFIDFRSVENLIRTDDNISEIYRKKAYARHMLEIYSPEDGMEPIKADAEENEAVSSP